MPAQNLASRAFGLKKHQGDVRGSQVTVQRWNVLSHITFPEQNWQLTVIYIQGGAGWRLSSCALHPSRRLFGFEWARCNRRRKIDAVDKQALLPDPPTAWPEGALWASFHGNQGQRRLSVGHGTDWTEPG